jgi:hypothetical protein
MTLLASKFPVYQRNLRTRRTAFDPVDRLLDQADFLGKV